MPCSSCGKRQPLRDCPHCQTTAAVLQPPTLPDLVIHTSRVPEGPVFRFSKPDAGGYNSRQTLGKRCPRCGLGHRLEAEACDRCGRAFQTVFIPKPSSKAGTASRRRKHWGWGISGLTALAALLLWLAVSVLSARGESGFQFACACYGQDRARHEQAGDDARRAAYWEDYARRHFISGAADFPGGERVLLYDQSRGNIPVGLIVMRRAGGGWQRLPDDAH